MFFVQIIQGVLLLEKNTYQATKNKEYRFLQIFHLSGLDPLQRYSCTTFVSELWDVVQPYIPLPICHVNAK